MTIPRDIHWTCKKSQHWLGHGPTCSWDATKFAGVPQTQFEVKKFAAGWRLRVGTSPWQERAYKTSHEVMDAAEYALLHSRKLPIK